MADENKKIQDNADGIPDNIDELLENAGKSLSELSDEVGEDSSTDKENIELDKTEGDEVNDVDSILSELTAELENIGEEIEGDEKEDSVEVHEVEQPEADSVAETQESTEAAMEDIVEEAAAAEPETIAEVEDDPLAELTAELEAINGESLIDMKEDMAPAPEAEEPQQEVEDIVAEQEIAADIELPVEQEAPAAKAEDNNEDESVDDVLARLANEISEDNLNDSDDAGQQQKSVSGSANIPQNDIQIPQEPQEQELEAGLESPVESDETVEAVEGVESLGADHSEDGSVDEIARKCQKMFRMS